jgi:hypothetical protein
MEPQSVIANQTTQNDHAQTTWLTSVAWRHVICPAGSRNGAQTFATQIPEHANPHAKP